MLTTLANFKSPRSPTIIIQCAKGHEWRTCAYNIVTNGSWCKRCRLTAPSTLLTLEDMHRLAAKSHGKCLSATYGGAHSHLEWECAKGHRWRAKPSNIKSGRWCPICRGEELSDKFRRTDALKFYREIAESRGGRLLTDSEPKNAQQSLKWECARGHRWLAKANSIHNGRWCPNCSGGVGERICRVYFEVLFGHSFPSTWPEWLIIHDTRRQLDGSCSELKLAFEHQGEQHYSELAGSHFARNPLSIRQEVDRQQVDLCQKHGVTLIRVP